jgi:hypothetical protein
MTRRPLGDLIEVVRKLLMQKAAALTRLVLRWGMDRARIELHLASAEEHVALAGDTVERQREIIVKLELDGHGIVEAQRLLVYFEEQLAMHVADRDRLRKELAEISD